MEGPAFDDPGPPVATPVSRVRRALTVAVLLTLVVAMVVLAFVSGRGVVTAPPSELPPATIGAIGGDASHLAVVAADGSLSTTDALGGSQVRYGDAGIDFSFPAWSPDGTRIAAIGKGPDETAVYVFTTPADGAPAGPPTIVYSSADRPPFYLYWSPDGQGLTFLSTEPDGLALRLAPADASAPAAVIRQGAPMYWTWAEETRLLVRSGGEGLAGFFGEIRPDGVATEPTAILPGGFRVPAVSSDGRFRAYVTQGDGTTQPIVADTREGTDPHTLDVFGTAALAFGPGSDELAIVAAAEPRRETSVPVGPLRLMDASSGRVRTLLSGTVIGAFWAPDGKTIAAIGVPAPGDDNIASTGPGVLVSTRSTGRAAAAGAKLRISFVNVESGAIRSHWSFVLSALFIDQILPYFDQYALSHRVWSPDGASIALPVVEDGTERIMVIQADGSGARTVTDGVAGFWSP